MQIRTMIAVGAAGLLAGFLIGRSQGPAAIEFPAAEETRTAAEMEEAVEKALFEPRAFPRSVALTRLFEGLSLENVEGAAAAMSARSGRWDPVDLQLFLSGWVHLDAESAMREVHGWPIKSRREMGLTIVMREWAASGGAIEAVDYFQQVMADPKERALVAGPLVRGWALSGDTRGALGLARRIWDQLGQRDVVDGFVRGVLHRNGPEATLALVRRLEPNSAGPFEQRIARVSMNLVGREAPVEAAALYAELEEGASAAQDPEWLGGMLDRLAAMLRKDDHERALVWVLRRKSGEERDRALTETMGAWATLDLDDATAWFSARRGDALAEQIAVGEPDSVVLEALVWRQARVRPKEAAVWVERLADAKARSELRWRIAWFWAVEDEAGAKAWLDTLPVEEARRAALSKRMDEAIRNVTRARAAAREKDDAARSANGGAGH